MTTAGPLPIPQLVRPASTYRITVAQHLDDHWIDWLGGHTLTRNEDASTTVTLDGVDQAQLHGVLSRIRDIGVDLLAVSALDGRPAHRSDEPDSDGSTPEDPEPVARPETPPPLVRTLCTERLTLRPATENDAEPTWAYRRLDAVNEWLTGAPAGLEQYRSLFCEPSRLAATVLVELVDDSRPHVIGDFMLRLEDAWSQVEVTDRAKDAQAELGWVLDPAHTGSGYATEAVRELLRYCFEELDVHRVVANCFLANDTSWRLMERVGMRRETHAIGESLHRCGQWLDTVGYAVLAHEWKGQHPRARQQSKEPK